VSHLNSLYYEKVYIAVILRRRHKKLIYVKKYMIFLRPLIETCRQIT